MYRPEGWKKTELLDESINRKDYDLGFEAGADAILEALFKLAKESPTGTFTIDSRQENAFKGTSDDNLH